MVTNRLHKFKMHLILISYIRLSSLAVFMGNKRFGLNGLMVFMGNRTRSLGLPAFNENDVIILKRLRRDDRFTVMPLSILL